MDDDPDFLRHDPHDHVDKGEAVQWLSDFVAQWRLPPTAAFSPALTSWIAPTWSGLCPRGLRAPVAWLKCQLFLVPDPGFDSPLYEALVGVLCATRCVDAASRRRSRERDLGK